jgi:hypothetical protein
MDAPSARQSKSAMQNYPVAQRRLNMDNPSSYQIGGDHYASKAVQPWDAMESWMTKEAFAGYLHGNCIKYLARYKDKNGTQDLQKCQHYLSKLIEVEQSEQVREEEND